jgi:hypothetical protein
MQARSPMQVLLSVKSVASQFLAKPRIVCAEAPQMPRREAASRYSRFPRSGKRLLTGLFRKAQSSKLRDLEGHRARLAS